MLNMNHPKLILRIFLWNFVCLLLGASLAVGWRLGLQRPTPMTEGFQRLIGLYAFVGLPLAVLSAYALGQWGIPKRAVAGGLFFLAGTAVVSAQTTEAPTWIVIGIPFAAATLIMGAECLVEWQGSLRPLWPRMRTHKS